MEPKVHDFYEDLDFSQQASEEPFWQAIYRQAFPTMLFAQIVKENGDGQRSGIDRVIYLKEGRHLYIDEKKRRKVYPDFCLEFANAYQLKNSHLHWKYTVGWMNKPLRIDYLAYAFIPTSTAYLLDWLSLKRIWQQYKEIWLTKAGGQSAIKEAIKKSKRQSGEDGFSIVPAENKRGGYITLSLAVPISIILQAITEPIIVSLVTNN